MSTRSVLAFGVAVASGLAVFAYAAPSKTSSLKSRKTASAFEQPEAELGESWGPENQAQVDEIIQTTVKMLVERSKNDTLIRRDAHPKHHGCVKAFFKINAAGLPDELRTGVFAPGAKAEYPAWIRFSNGNPDGASAPDLNRDLRGMAVKLMNVDGARSGSQDFVMCNSKEFFSKDGKDYIALHRALAKSKTAIAWYFLTHPRDAVIFASAQSKVGNPLQTEYFSALPYKLGNTAMRFKVEPCPSGEAFDPVPGKDASPNYLRERLIATLAARSACFEFFVQPNRDLEGQPVEDPRISWDETVSPYIKVATITIPRQSEIDSDAQLNFCENVSFDPWHTLPGTRPLGQISRMRGEIYPAISEFRHQHNGVPVLEPRSHEVCSSDEAALCRAPKLVHNN